MSDRRTRTTERLQRMVARLIAISPAGQGIALIGGFRYRLLDHGARRSLDVDYHCTDDLADRQDQLVRLFSRRLLPEASRTLGLSGTAAAAQGPGAESPTVKTINLAFWSDTEAMGRIEIPVEITRIVCLDPPEVRTADGVVYTTPSNADLIESKIIAIINRTFLQYRDLVDLYLFSSHLHPDSTQRLAHKLSRLGIAPDRVDLRLKGLDPNNAGQARAIDAIIDEQVDDVTAETLRNTGGGALILRETVRILEEHLQGDAS